jgi:hypothetical protein
MEKLFPWLARVCRRARPFGGIGNLGADRQWSPTMSQRIQLGKQGVIDRLDHTEIDLNNKRASHRWRRMELQVNEITRAKTSGIEDTFPLKIGSKEKIALDRWDSSTINKVKAQIQSVSGSVSLIIMTIHSTGGSGQLRPPP